MNERIYELIRLSAVPADQAEDYALDKGLVEPTEKLDVARFAQLIIKETLQVARAGIEYGDGMEDAVYKYFGVEL